MKALEVLCMIPLFALALALVIAVKNRIRPEW